MAEGQRFKTGDKVPQDGQFAFDSYVGNIISPSPAGQDRFVALKAGQTLPAVNGKAAYWMQKR
ncbi:MAG: YjzC family protein [Phycisphaeraceae bacterium]|nr:YjzC family protein [Phycisphaeraceae bacterium]